MTDIARRLAALSQEQQAALLRELTRARQGEPAPPAAVFPPLVARPAERYQPFPLTDIQEVYWAGRSGYLDLSTPGPGANVYIEYEITGGGEPFLQQLEAGLRHMFDRHEILRLTMLPDGRQQLLDPVPPYRIERVDLRSLPPEEAHAVAEETREQFRYHPGRAGTWPLFGFRAAFLDGDRIRLHIWLDCWLIDGLSRDNLINDLFLALADPAVDLPPLSCTYRDYALSWKDIRASHVYRRAREHWLRRIPYLPPAPELPLAEPLSPRTRTRYTNVLLRILDAGPWQRLKERATRRGLTPSIPLIMAFVEVLRAWSCRPSFSITLEGTYWPPSHPQLREIVGNFNTVYLLQTDDTAGTFAERSRRLQDQLTEVLDHRAFSGFQVLREIRRHRGAGTASIMPVMFNSLVEYTHPGHQAQAGPPRVAGADFGSVRFEQIELGGNLPQLLMLPAVFENADGSLFFKLQVVEHVFLPGVVPTLRDAYMDLVRRLSTDEAAWDAPSFLLTPAAQLAARRTPKGLAVQINPGGEIARLDLDAASASAVRELNGLLDLGADDRVLALSPATIGPALWEDFGPAAVGANVFRPESANPADWAELVSREAPTVWSGPPAFIERLAAHLSPAAVPSPRLVVLTRGQVPVSLPGRLRSLAPGLRVAILTELPEVPIAAALLEVEEVPETLVRFSAGRPLAGYRLLALDHALEERPDWVPGRLWVAGPGLAHSDRGGPEGRRLAIHPRTGERLLDTGLLARWLPDGGIEVLGREEVHSFEVAGHPVELRRIEAVLERSPRVRAVVAGAWTADGRRRLAAWIVPAAGVAPDPGELANWLSASLPDFMVPAAFVFLEELPLTPTGGVDRAALPTPPSPDLPNGFVPPSDALEERLAGFYRELLGVDRLGIGDDFFTLGGDSFTAVRLLARVEEQWGRRDLSSFFLEPTVFHLAGLIREPRAD